MKIQQVKIEKVIPYARNPRKNEAAITKVAASLTEFGWQQPIVVDKEMVVIAGHTRLQAAKRLNMETVPIFVADHLTETQVKAYRIADNRVHQEADWDTELLKLEFADLKDADFDLAKTGFDDDELNDLLAEAVKEGLTDEDAVPEVPEEPKTKSGDIYKLGRHRLMCGDSTSIDAVEKLLDDQEVDFMFTSPPYNAGDSEKLSGNTHTTDNKYATYRDDKTQDDYLEFLQGFTNAWMWSTKCMAVNIQQLAGNKIAFIDYLNSYKNHLVDIAIWDKKHGAPQMARNVMSNRFEYIVFLAQTENPSRAIPTAEFQGTVQNVYDGQPNRNNEFSKVHAATFPVDFPEWAINNFTMELDPKYCDVIVKRWEEFTGKKAELVNGSDISS